MSTRLPALLPGASSFAPVSGLHLRFAGHVEVEGWSSVPLPARSLFVGTTLLVALTVHSVHLAWTAERGESPRGPHRGVAGPVVAAAVCAPATVGVGALSVSLALVTRP